MNPCLVSGCGVLPRIIIIVVATNMGVLGPRGFCHESLL